MPLKLEIKKQLSARSERVKSVDFHPTEPWVLAGMYSGTVTIWDYSTQSVVRQMEVSNLPIRCAKFVVRRQWIIVGCDDMTIKILNYNTLEKIKSLENSHTDYIRHVAVHPTLPLLLTSSDDMTIKLWDWEKNWQNVATFEGHSHYVMMVQWNPKESTGFASASLDRTIKFWSFNSPASCNFTLSGHTRGVNCIDYLPHGEKPYLISGSDDKTVRVWDYQTKQCVHVLEGHSGNVSSVAFHPMLPVILTGSEDGVCKIWHANTYRLENSLNYMLDRLWSISVMKTSHSVALGYDEGTVVIQLGSEEPVVSFNQGKIIWSKNKTEIQTVNLKQLEEAAIKDLVDGEVVPNVPVKDMGACELFPQSIAHHPSGRLFAVCGDGEYVIYTAQVLRNKSFGPALGFAWSPEGHYATRLDNNKISVFHNFKESFSFKPDFTVEEIYSGHLLCVRSSDFLVFYDWNEYRVIRRIDVVASNIIWSMLGESVAIVTPDTLFVLAHDKHAVSAAAIGEAPIEEGVEAAFDLLNEINNESVKSGVWVSESCFVFANDKLKLCTLVGGQVEVLAHLESQLTVLGYMPEHARIYCSDQSLNIVSFELQLSLVRYKSAVVAGDIALAERLFPDIPANQHTKLARFLEQQGYRNEALEITKDAEHKFELATSMGKLDLAEQILVANFDEDASKWNLIGDKATELGLVELAQRSFEKSSDASSLLLIASCTGDSKLVAKAAELATLAGDTNVALTARFILRDYPGCVETLMQAGLLGEAALFARTYCQDKLEEVVPLWKADLAKTNEKVANAMVAPATAPKATVTPKTTFTQLPVIKQAVAETTSKAAAAEAEFASPASSRGTSPKTFKAPIVQQPPAVVSPSVRMNQPVPVVSAAPAAVKLPQVTPSVPVNQPTVHKPPVVEPAVVHSPVAQPRVVQPPVTQPPVVQPPPLSPTRVGPASPTSDASPSRSAPPAVTRPAGVAATSTIKAPPTTASMRPPSSSAVGGPPTQRPIGGPPPIPGRTTKQPAAGPRTDDSSLL